MKKQTAQHCTYVKPSATRVPDGLQRLLCVAYREEYDGDVEFDLGNLMASGRGPLDTERFKSEPDAACLEVATHMTQSLIARLFQLPSQQIPVSS